MELAAGLNVRGSGCFRWCTCKPLPLTERLTLVSHREFALGFRVWARGLTVPRTGRRGCYKGLGFLWFVKGSLNPKP